MQEPQVFRTAAIVSLVAAIIGSGWMELQGDDMQVDPAAVPVAGAQSELGYYFPAGFTLQPNAAEAEGYEFY
jgi:hypothetical protein